MNFIRLFNTGRNIIVHPQLGRWKLNDNIKRKIDLANIDNCGDNLCGIPISKELKYTIENNDKKKIGGQTIESLVNDYNRRWKQNLTVEEFKKNFKY